MVAARAHKLDEIDEIEQLLGNGLYDAALNAVNQCGGSQKAAVLRAVALAGLQHYEEALEVVAGLDASDPDTRAEELRGAIELLQQQCLEGNFNFEDVYGAAMKARAEGGDPAQRTAPSTLGLLPRLADYIGPVRVQSTEYGRGLVATANVTAGEILLCCRPLAMTASGGPSGADPIVSDLHHKCKHSGFVTHIISNFLYDGSTLPRDPALEEFSWSCADIATARRPPSESIPTEDRISKIVATNCFGEYGYSMLFPAVSMANHSCIPNASTLLVGTTIFIRANQAIQAGDEVCISYFDVLRPVLDRERRTKNWNFKCQCARCQFERTLPDNLQDSGVSADDVEHAIKTADIQVDTASRQVQWLRASHLKEYKEQLEQVFPFGDDGVWQRSRYLRAVEATDPGSFTHVKMAFLDWLSKQNQYSPSATETQQAMRYCDLVHQARYGSIPGKDMIPLLKHTQAAVVDAGVGVEFCTPKPRCTAPESLANQDATQARTSPQAAPNVVMLD